MIIFILMNFAWAGSLNSDCYDKNLGKACFELSQKLLSGKTPSDRTRGDLARQKACKLGVSAACAPAAGKESSVSKGDGLGTKAAVVPASSETIKLKRSDVEKDLENLPALLQDASMEARNPGYEFTQIEPKSVYDKIGFKVGDILLEINGHVVESSLEAMNLFVLLRDEKNFEVKIKRAGKISVRKYQVTD